MERLPDVEVVFHIGHFERSPVGEFSYTTLAAAHTMERKMTGSKIRSAYRYLNGQGAGPHRDAAVWLSPSRRRQLPAGRGGGGPGAPHLRPLRLGRLVQP